MGSRSLLQGTFPVQGWNPGLPHCRWILHQLSHQGSPWLPTVPIKALMGWETGPKGAPGNLVVLGIPRSPVDHGGWVTPTKGFHTQTRRAWGSPGSDAHPLESRRDMPGETLREGVARDHGPRGSGLWATQLSLPTERKTPRLATPGSSELPPPPTTSQPAAPAQAPPLGWHYLKSHSPAGGLDLQLPQWKEPGAAS